MRLRYEADYTNEYFTFMEEERTTIIGPEFVKRLIALTGQHGGGAQYMGISLADLVDAAKRGEIPDVLSIHCWSADKMGKATVVLNHWGVDTSVMSDSEILKDMDAAGFTWDSKGKVWVSKGGVRYG